MQIFFGVDTLLSNSDFEMFHTDTLPGEQFYFMVEFGTNPGGFGEVAIHDTCDRVMPVPVEDIPALIASLERVYEVSKQLEIANSFTEMALNSEEVFV